jgi:S-adenosylmethionine:diacylglycerol 3-amino-3-carboxypropyl transferase
MDSPWQAGRLTIGRRPQVMFGRMYEDHGVELSLFAPASRVLAIASAGDTAAALAGAGHQVTAVDINPVQLAYGKARMAGAPTVTGTAERLMSIGRLAAAAVAPAWRREAMTRFLRMDDPARQAHWWRGEMDRPQLRALMAATLRPAGPLSGLLRPGLAAVIPARFDVALRQRIGACAARYPNATNPWIWRLLLGRGQPDDGHAAPDIRAQRPAGTGPASSGGITWVHADVIAHLEQAAAGYYDAVTLSNVLDGPASAYADRLHAALRHAVRPGGAVVLRTFHHRSPLAGRPLEDRSVLWGAVVEVAVGD